MAIVVEGHVWEGHVLVLHTLKIKKGLAKEKIGFQLSLSHLIGSSYFKKSPKGFFEERRERVNFTNVLRPSFYASRSQKQKKTVKRSVEKSWLTCGAAVLQWIFALGCVLKFDEIDPRSPRSDYFIKQHPILLIQSESRLMLSEEEPGPKVITLSGL